MYGVTINCQFRPIKTCQFEKWNGKPIFNEKKQSPKDLILAADKMKNHWRNDYVTIKIQHETLKHNIFKEQNKSGEKEEKETEE